MTMTSPRSQTLTRLIAAAVAGLAVGSVALASSASAQAANGADALKDFNQPDSNPFSNRDNSSRGVLDLIHKAQLGAGKSVEEFNAEQAESLDAATAAFRAQQRQQLSNRQTTPLTGAPQVSPTAPVAPVKP